MDHINICWNCKHDILKLEILVPQNSTINEYMNNTNNFESIVIAIVKDSQGVYSIWFRSAGTVKLLSFRMLHECKLKQEEGGEGDDCQNYETINGNNQVANITYTKHGNSKK
jgi:hypothetical protein